MKLNRTQTILIVVVIALAIYLVWKPFANPYAPDPDFTTAYKVQCTFVADRQWAVDVTYDIINPVCKKVGTCPLYLSAVSTQSIFSDISSLFYQKGSAELTDPARTIITQQWAHQTGSSGEPFTLEGCTKYKTVKIVLKDSKNNIVATKEVQPQ